MVKETERQQEGGKQKSAEEDGGGRRGMFGLPKSFQWPSWRTLAKAQRVKASYVPGFVQRLRHQFESRAAESVCRNWTQRYTLLSSWTSEWDSAVKCWKMLKADGPFVRQSQTSSLMASDKVRMVESMVLGVVFHGVTERLRLSDVTQILLKTSFLISVVTWTSVVLYC